MINKLLPFFAMLLLAQTAFSQVEYQMVIDGKSYDVNLSQEFTYISESGDSILFELKATGNPVVSQQPVQPIDFSNAGNDKLFNDVLINFNYPDNYSFAKTRPSNDIQQITMVSGQGGGIIIQEFLGIDPSSLIDFFLGGLIGNEKLAAAKSTTISSNNNVRLTGKHALDSDGKKVSVYSYGKQGKGILIALIGDETTDELLQSFVKSIEVKF